MSRGRIILGPVWLALTALLVVAWLCFREPRAGGEPLSYWLRLGAGPATFEDIVPRNPQSEVAIREIGSQAIPILLAKLQALDPPWKDPLHHWLNKQDFVRIDFTWGHEEQQQALYGFTVLGSNAIAALPALEIMFTNPATAWNAGQAMREIGWPALPALRQGFTNAAHDIRLAALAGTFRPDLARATLADMPPLLNDSDRNVAMLALRHQLLFLPRGEATEAAIAALQGDRPHLRVSALRLLNRMLIETNKVVPVLVRLLAQPDQRMSRFISDTLKELDPVAAAAAGVNTNPPPVASGRGGRRRPTPATTNAPPQP